MTGEHLVGGIVCDNLDITRLRETYEHGVSRAPGRLRLPPSFRSGDYKLAAVEVDRVVVHAEIDQANQHALTLPDDQGCCRRSRFTVERDPVALYVHGVRSRAIGPEAGLLK